MGAGRCGKIVKPAKYENNNEFFVIVGGGGGGGGGVGGGGGCRVHAGVP